MEDKREIANKELEQSLNGGLLSFAPQHSENFVELPHAPSAEDTSTSAGSVYNNFNVNVNVNKVSNNTSQTTRAIQNALPVTSEIPELLKKNSPTLLARNLESEKSSEQLRGIVNSEIHQPNLIELAKNSEENTATISLMQLAGVDEFDLGDASQYEYTSSDFKENNAGARHDAQVMQNIIQHSVSEQNITNIMPSSAAESSVNVNLVNQNKSVQMQDVTVVNNNQSPIDHANEAVRKQERIENIETQQVERSTKQVAKDKQFDKQEKDDIEEAVSVSIKDGAGSPKMNSKNPRKSKNFNGTPSTIPMFMNQMNSPPSWRTVLG